MSAPGLIWGILFMVKLKFPVSIHDHSAGFGPAHDVIDNPLARRTQIARIIQRAESGATTRTLPRRVTKQDDEQDDENDDRTCDFINNLEHR